MAMTPVDRFVRLADALEPEWRAWALAHRSPAGGGRDGLPLEPPVPPPALRRVAREHARAIAASLPTDRQAPGFRRAWDRFVWARSVPLCEAVLERWWSEGLPNRGLALQMSFHATTGSPRATGKLLRWWLAGLAEPHEWCRWVSVLALEPLVRTHHRPVVLRAAREALERESYGPARWALAEIVHHQTDTSERLGSGPPTRR